MGGGARLSVRRETNWRKLGRLSPTLGGQKLGPRPLRKRAKTMHTDWDPFMLSDTRVRNEA